MLKIIMWCIIILKVIEGMSCAYTIYVDLQLPSMAKTRPDH